MSPSTGGGAGLRPVLVADGALPWGRRRQLGRGGARADPALAHSSAVPGQRFRYVHDTRGPKVRLGTAWFALLIAACWAAGAWRDAGPAPLLLALPLTTAAVVAALQSAAALREVGRRASRSAAAAGASMVGLASARSSQLVGAAVLVAVVASALQAARGPRSFADGGWDRAASTVRCWLFVGLAAAAPVLSLRVEPARAIVLVTIAAAYDAGDFLVGSAAANPVEGPVAGMIGALVVTFAIAVVEPPGFVGGQAWVLGLLAIVLCPLGPLLASVILPRAASFAPGLRRLDSLLLVGPVWLAAWH